MAGARTVRYFFDRATCHERLPAENRGAVPNETSVRYCNRLAAKNLHGRRQSIDADEAAQVRHRSTIRGRIRARTRWSDREGILKEGCTTMLGIKRKLAAGELVKVFSIARVLHPTVVEMFGLGGGYDGMWVDQEHGGATYEQIHTLSLAARANRLDCFVRMAPTGYSAVTQCLEAGAGGVMAAQIHSADEARQFLEWAHFPPLGKRGLNTGGSDGRYTHRTPREFVEAAVDETFVGIQIETAGALEQVDAIAQLPGLDLLFVGPSDLSLSIGHVGEFHSDPMWEAMQTIADAANRHGVPWAVLPPDPKFALRAVELGCRMLSIANDPLIMRRGIEAFQANYDAFFTA